MNYLLDTNVLSELRKKLPHPLVASWVQARPASQLFISVLTLGEIRKGVDMLQPGQRKDALSDWLATDLPAYFAGRILPIDVRVADRWGALQAGAGRSVPAVDSLLAATAIECGMTFVTRNVKDFAGLSLQLIDPWQLP